MQATSFTEPAQGPILSVIIPTHNRTDRLLETLSRVYGCSPPPCEVLVHFDAGDDMSADAVERHFPHVRLLSSRETQGPGGGRNLLILAANSPIIVSLDDDSYPLDPDFFENVCRNFDKFPEAGVLAMKIFHNDEPIVDRSVTFKDSADFIGCGCAYRRSAFLETPGYVALNPAYGMEEVDLSLQLLDIGWRVVDCGNLRVRHETDRSNQLSHRIVAAHIYNTALLVFLRYPLGVAFLGIAQVFNRILYSTRRRHFTGVLIGIAKIPWILFKYGSCRKPVSAATVRYRRELAR